MLPESKFVSQSVGSVTLLRFTSPLPSDELNTTMSESSIPGSITVRPFEAAASSNGSRKNVGKLSRVTAILLPSGDQAGLMSHTHRSSLIWRVAAVTVTPSTGRSTVQSGVLSICVDGPPVAGAT